MIKLSSFLPVILLLFTGTLFTCKARGEGTIELPQLLQEAERSNPEISAARSRYLAEVQRVKFKSFLPDPTLGLSVRNEGWDSKIAGEMMSSAGISFSQHVPFPGKLIYRRKALGFLAEAEKMNFESVRLRVRRSIRTAFYDLWFLHRERRILHDMLLELQKARDSAISLYRVGKVMQEHVLRAEVEISRVKEKLIINGMKEDEVRWKLARLMGRMDEKLTGTPVLQEGILPAFTREVTQIALKYNPELRRQEAIVQASRNRRKEAVMDWLPDISFGFGWYIRDGFSNIYEARLGLELPLYFWQNQIPEVKEATNILSSSESTLADLRDRIVTRLSALLKLYTDSIKLVNLYDRLIIPQSESAVQSARSAYEVGKLDFLNFIEDELILFRYRIQRAKRYSSCLKYLAMIMEITGEKAFPEGGE